MREVYTYAYDANGNLIKDSHAEYEYDGFNRLREVRTADGNIQKNRYDAEGLRAELEENGELVRFLYHGGEVVAETNEQGETIRYIRGLGLISSDSEKAKTYYHYVSDERGSITDIVKAAVRKKLAEDAISADTTEDKAEDAAASGNQETGVLNHYEYDAFGNSLACEETVANRFRFTGEIYDAVTAQYYLRARFYNPVLGRFMQEDDRYTDGLNLYAYCKNNPVRYTDPSGHNVTSGPDRENDVPDDTDSFYEDMYDNQRETIPEYEDYLDAIREAQAEAAADAQMSTKPDEVMSSESDQIFSLRDLMIPEQVAGYDAYWYNVGTQKAIDARDAVLKEISTWSNSKRNDIVTVVGAVDLDTGNVAVGIKSARTHRGIYVNGKYICAEDLAVGQLGGNKSSIVMTAAIRPRTNNPKSVCVHCQKIYSNSQFMEDVEFE